MNYNINVYSTTPLLYWTVNYLNFCDVLRSVYLWQYLVRLLKQWRCRKWRTIKNVKLSSTMRSKSIFRNLKKQNKYEWHQLLVTRLSTRIQYCEKEHQTYKIKIFFSEQQSKVLQWQYWLARYRSSLSHARQLVLAWWEWSREGPKWLGREKLAVW